MHNKLIRKAEIGLNTSSLNPYGLNYSLPLSILDNWKAVDDLMRKDALHNNLSLISSSDPQARQFGKETLELSTGLKPVITGGDSSKFDISKYSNTASIVGQASDLISSFMPSKTEYLGDKGSITQTMDSVYDGISNAAMMLGPMGMVVGGIMKGGKLLGLGVNALGGGTDGMTTTDAILGSSFLNLTPLGLINGFGGKRTDSITKDYDLFETMGSSYSGTSSTIDDALTKSSKKYGLFSRGAMNKANSQIAEAKRLLSIVEDIESDAANRINIRNSMSAINGNKRDFSLQGGYNQSSVRAAKHGMSIDSFIYKEFDEIVECIEEQNEFIYEDIDKFLNGGSINIIPEGALHARKHNIDLEGITKKGIPVISEGEGGEIQQQAEIEHSEIIFRLEVTLKLEELSKIANDTEKTLKEKDEAAIEAGKLLTKEILYNTDDRTNLINNGE